MEPNESSVILLLSLSESIEVERDPERGRVVLVKRPFRVETAPAGAGFAAGVCERVDCDEDVEEWVWSTRPRDKPER